MRTCDFLIIGSGVAGLSLARALARHGRVVVVTKKDPRDSSTNLAQGGIAAVIDPEDDVALHVRDTLETGAGLCRREVVEMVVREGPQRVRDLMELGVPFTADASGELDLGLEGGHSRHRIVHCADLTGAAIERALLDAVRAQPNVELLAWHMAVNLITDRHLENPRGEDAVWGAYVLDVRRGTTEAIVARRTVLATGGAGKVYRYTSNPDVATGDGVAMAYRAGARVANLEFVQFHPTCLYHPELRTFLISEALRGEGGRLVNRRGERFVSRFDARGELAPRDVVARAIDAELKATGEPCVFLDVRHLDGAFLERRFPNILAQCRRVGIDPCRERIPVVPAMHYLCGGVDVDTDGRASVANLFAVGEVAHTGLHGANRLASNSLLEALVYAQRAYRAMHAAVDEPAVPRARPWEDPGDGDPPPAVLLEHDWDLARRIMWDFVGIVRSDERLDIARERLRLIAETVESVYWTCRLSADLVELRNIVLVGRMIVACACWRRESRGLHFTESHPERDDERFRRDTIVGQEGAEL